MKIKMSDRPKRAPYPRGAYPAVCCDVIDLGLVDTQFGPVPKVQHAFYLPPLKDDDPPWVSVVRAKPFAQKMSRTRKGPSHLLAFLEAWRGEEIPAAELRGEGYELEDDIGRPALVSIVHFRTQDGREYANIATIMPLPGNMEAPKVPANYRRWTKDREQDHDELKDDPVPRAGGAEDPEAPISPQKIRLLMAKAHLNGVNDDKLHTILDMKYQIKSRKDIKNKWFDDVMSELSQ